MLPTILKPGKGCSHSLLVIGIFTRCWAIAASVAKPASTRVAARRYVGFMGLLRSLFKLDAVARVERSETRGSVAKWIGRPGFRSAHPGYIPPHNPNTNSMVW